MYDYILVDDDTIYVVGMNDERVGIISIYEEDGDYVIITDDTNKIRYRSIYNDAAQDRIKALHQGYP